MCSCQRRRSHEHPPPPGVLGFLPEFQNPGIRAGFPPRESYQNPSSTSFLARQQALPILLLVVLLLGSVPRFCPMAPHSSLYPAFAFLGTN